LLFLFKTVLIVFIAVLVRGSLPRKRVDQYISQNWKYFVFSYL